MINFVEILTRKELNKTKDLFTMAFESYIQEAGSKYNIYFWLVLKRHLNFWK